jgi:hypothetical protein
MCASFGLRRREADAQDVADWVSGIFRQLEALLVQFQAGHVVACDDVETEVPQRTREARVRVAGGKGRTSGDAGSVSERLADCDYASVETAQIAKTTSDIRDFLTIVAAWRDFGAAQPISFKLV